MQLNAPLFSVLEPYLPYLILPYLPQVSKLLLTVTPHHPFGLAFCTNTVLHSYSSYPGYLPCANVDDTTMAKGQPMKLPATLATSLRSLPPTHTSASQTRPDAASHIVINISSNDGSTSRGVLIGLLSAFGSAAFVVLVFAIFYFFRHTTRGRILLDRLGRPGEYDDEQAFAREEAEALEDMDDLQKAEYLRAKGICSMCLQPRPYNTRVGLTVPSF